MNPRHHPGLAAGESNRRILVVDDNESIHNDFRKILGGDAVEAAFDAAETMVFGPREAPVRRAAFALHFATQGEGALQLVRAAVEKEERYAVAFVDMRMPPGWNGLQTTQKLWEADPDLQIVLCTAYSDYSWDEMMSVARSPERLLILKKPFDAVEVMQLAHALTEKWALLQQARSNTEALESQVEQRTLELRGVNALLQKEIAGHEAAHAALQKEREFLAAIVENVTDGIVSCDAAGVITLFNGATREFHGLPAEPVPAEQWAKHFDIFLEDGITPMQMEQIPLFRALQEGSVRDAEMVVAPRHGVVRRVLASGRAFANAQGEKQGAVVVMHDITEREKVLAALRASEAKLENAQRIAQIGSWQCDLETGEIECSDEVYRIFHLSPEFEPTAEAFFGAIHPEDRAAVRAASETAQAGGARFSIDHRILRPDGAECIVHEEAEIKFDEAGRALLHSRDGAGHHRPETNRRRVTPGRNEISRALRKRVGGDFPKHPQRRDYFGQPRARSHDGFRQPAGVY